MEEEQLLEGNGVGEDDGYVDDEAGPLVGSEEQLPARKGVRRAQQLEEEADDEEEMEEGGTQGEEAEEGEEGQEDVQMEEGEEEAEEEKQEQRDGSAGVRAAGRGAGQRMVVENSQGSLMVQVRWLSKCRDEVGAHPRITGTCRILRGTPWCWAFWIMRSEHAVNG